MFLSFWAKSFGSFDSVLVLTWYRLRAILPYWKSYSKNLLSVSTRTLLLLSEAICLTATLVSAVWTTFSLRKSTASILPCVPRYSRWR